DCFQSPISKFDTFYKLKHEGRKLLWTSAGTVELVAKFTKKQFEINIPFLYAAILLLFNSKEWLITENVSSTLGIPITEVENAAMRLSTEKTKIIQFKDGRLVLNQNFTTNHSKLTIPAFPKQSIPLPSSAMNMKNI